MTPTERSRVALSVRILLLSAHTRPDDLTEHARYACREPDDAVRVIATLSRLLAAGIDPGPMSDDELGQWVQ